MTASSFEQQKKTYIFFGGRRSLSILLLVDVDFFRFANEEKWAKRTSINRALIAKRIASKTRIYFSVFSEFPNASSDGDIWAHFSRYSRAIFSMEFHSEKRSGRIKALSFECSCYDSTDITCGSNKFQTSIHFVLVRGTEKERKMYENVIPRQTLLRTSRFNQFIIARGARTAERKWPRTTRAGGR